MKYKAKLNYENSQEVGDAINRLNERYKSGSRSFKHIEIAEGLHQIEVRDEIELLPYGIFEVGAFIGARWMHENYRIELGRWQKRINQELFEDDYHPTVYDKTKIYLKDNQPLEFNVKDAVGITSSFNTIKPYFTASTLKRIVEFSEFKQVPNLNSTVYLSKNDLILHYHIFSGFLLIFGIKNDHSNQHHFDIVIPFLLLGLPHRILGLIKPEGCHEKCPGK